MTKFVYCLGKQKELKFYPLKQHLTHKNRAITHIEKRTCSAIINQKVAKGFLEGKNGKKYILLLLLLSSFTQRRGA